MFSAEHIPAVVFRPEGLYVEEEVHDVAVLGHIVLALDGHLAGVAHC